MKKIVLMVSLVVVMVFALGCDREVSVFDDREPTVVTVNEGDSPAYVGMVSKVECGVVTNDADETDMNVDCAGLGVGWYCASNKQASDDLGSPTNLCVAGCYVVFGFDPYTGVQSKSYDSCSIIDEEYACSAPQFDGDGQCHKVTHGTTPTDTGTTPAATTTGKPLMACYSLTTSEISANFGQFSWPAPNTSNPNAYGTDQDRTIGSDGCYSGTLAPTASGGELIVDLTVGPQKGKKAADVSWVGKAKKPTKVMVEGKEATLSTTVFASGEPAGFDPYRGWVFKY